MLLLKIKYINIPTAIGHCNSYRASTRVEDLTQNNDMLGFALLDTRYLRKLIHTSSENNNNVAVLPINLTSAATINANKQNTTMASLTDQRTISSSPSTNAATTLSGSNLVNADGTPIRNHEVNEEKKNKSMNQVPSSFSTSGITSSYSLFGFSTSGSKQGTSNQQERRKHSSSLPESFSSSSSTMELRKCFLSFSIVRKESVHSNRVNQLRQQQGFSSEPVAEAGFRFHALNGHKV